MRPNFMARNERLMKGRWSLDSLTTLIKFYVYNLKDCDCPGGFELHQSRAFSACSLNWI